MSISEKSKAKIYYIAVNPKGQVMLWAGITSYETTLKRHMLGKSNPDEMQKFLHSQFDKIKRINTLWDEVFGCKGVEIVPINIKEKE